MKKLYGVTMSLAQHLDNPTTVTAFISEGDGETTRWTELSWKLGTVEAPEDPRDWLRQALAMMIEEL